MINLLSDDQRKDITYARRNTTLLHWAIAIVLAIVGLVFFVGAGYFYVVDAGNKYAKEVEAKQAYLQSQQLGETEQTIQDLSNNLKLILQVLSEEILFSKLLRHIGAVMPSGSVLSSIELTELEGGIDLVAATKDYDTGTQVQVNLQDDTNKLFDKVDIVSITCGGSDPEYPCLVTLRAKFAANNEFLFLNSGGQR